MWSDWLVFCDCGFSVSAFWCPLATSTVLLGFLLPWTWGISSRLRQQSAAAAPYLGWWVSPHGCPSWPWMWSSSSQRPPKALTFDHCLWSNEDSPHSPLLAVLLLLLILRGLSQGPSLTFCTDQALPRECLPAWDCFWCQVTGAFNCEISEKACCLAVIST